MRDWRVPTTFFVKGSADSAVAYRVSRPLLALTAIRKLAVNWRKQPNALIDTARIYSRVLSTWPRTPLRSVRDVHARRWPGRELARYAFFQFHSYPTARDFPCG